jgi:hypothetical protein
MPVPICMRDILGGEPGENGDLLDIIASCAGAVAAIAAGHRAAVRIRHGSPPIRPLAQELLACSKGSRSNHSHE